MLFRRHQESAEATTWGMLLAFAAAVALLLVAVNLALALALRLTVPLASGYPALFFETNTVVVLLFVLGGCWVETLRLREGGAYVARLVGARPAASSGRTPYGASERRLVNIVQEMALASRSRAPAVWVLPRDENINAFAAGWEPADAVVAVTQGALERLTRAELQGLVGHEISHLASGDTRLHMRLIGLVWGLQMVHGFGRTLAARDEQARVSFGVVIGLALLAVGWVGWLAGRLLQAAVARQREFHADASAVQYARTVDGIGGALRKIAGLPPLRRPPSSESLAHLWAVESGSSGASGWGRWLATHPPIAQRLQRIYGRPMEPLDAPLLPPPDDEPMLAPAQAPVQALAPTAAAGVRPAPMRRGFGQLADLAAGPAQAFQAAAATTRAERAEQAELAEQAEESAQDERDALQRAAFWRSRNERHAALLAWLIGADDAQAPWQAWRERFGDAAFIERLRDDWLALGPPARWRVFDAMVAHTRAASDDDRAALLQVARGLSRHGAARLRCLLLKRCLGGATLSRNRQHLEELAPALGAATVLLAQAMGPPGAAWAAAFEQAALPGTRAAPLQAFALRRLDAMQRPRVARAWAETAAKSGLLGDAAAANLLACACRLLDTPLPPALQRC